MSDTNDYMDAYIAGDSQKAQALSQPIDQPAGNDAPATDDPAFAPMPAAPKYEQSKVDNFIAKLNDYGGEHAALVQEWASTGANPGEEFAYAQAAFKQYATPELIAKIDASGLGNDPAIIKFLAKQGRLDAGMMGDFTVARQGSAPSEAPAFRGNGSKASLQAEKARLLEDNPIGSANYRKPSVQKRLAEINGRLFPDDIVGRGGRTG